MNMFSPVELQAALNDWEWDQIGSKLVPEGPKTGLKCQTTSSSTAWSWYQILTRVRVTELKWRS